MTQTQTRTQTIWCCGCNKDVQARLTNGAEIYGQRADLATQPFWKCDGCRNYVGCHWKSNQPTKPLGSIPTAAIRLLRRKLHSKLDDLWRFKGVHRGELYQRISEKLGYQYHSGEIRTAEECDKVIAIVDELIVEQDWG